MRRSGWACKPATPGWRGIPGAFSFLPDATATDPDETTMPNGKRAIAILTGGGDVPGLNPAIRAITIRALREGYRVVGIRRGWAGLVDYVRDAKADNSENVQPLTEATVNRAGRTGGTCLHTSRLRPSHLPRARVPAHLTGYDQDINDITKDVLKNLEHIGVDVLIPIG